MGEKTLWEESTMIVQSKRIWLEGKFASAQLVLEGEAICRVQPWGTEPADRDFGALRVVPGFLDLHTHGGYGYDTNDGQPEGLARWAAALPREGVTAFLPTTLTQPLDILEGACRSVAAAMAAQGPGAEILGVHLEGPFLSPARRGAQPRSAICPPDRQAFQRLQAAAGGAVRVLTLAPEEDRELALTQSCTAQGVRVNLGHSDCDYDTACRAANLGARGVTHVFNGMAHLHHRTPGLLGAALDREDLYGEVIGDGCHVSLPVLRLFFRCKGADRGILISDSLRLKGMPAGSRGLFGGREIALEGDGLIHLTEDGAIAGSALALDQALRRLVLEGGIPFPTVLNALTANPARYLGLEGRKGALAPGCDGDFVVLGEDWQVEETFCRGSSAYRRAARRDRLGRRMVRRETEP